MPSPPVRLRALSVPRHDCTRCGASCSSYRVGPLLADDIDKVRTALPEVRRAFPDQPLGDPLTQEDYRGTTATFLQKADGFCVLHRHGTGCTIHALLGGDAKPFVCRLFPLTLVQTDDGVRIGTLPTCLADAGVYNSAPPVPGGFVEEVVTDGRLASARPGMPGEGAVLSLLGRPGVTTVDLLVFLREAPVAEGGPDVSEWLTGRLADLLSAAEEVLAGDGDPGPLHPEATVGQHFDRFASWAASGPELWPEVDERALPWLRDALRRLVFLRETSRFPGLPWALLCYVAAARWASAFVSDSEAGFDLPRFGATCSALLIVLESPRIQRAVLAAGPPFR